MLNIESRLAVGIPPLVSSLMRYRAEQKQKFCINKQGSNVTVSSRYNVKASIRAYQNDLNRWGAVASIQHYVVEYAMTSINGKEKRQ